MVRFKTLHFTLTPELKKKTGFLDSQFFKPMIRSPSNIVKRKCCYPHWINSLKHIFAGAPGKYIWGIEVFMYCDIDVEVSSLGVDNWVFRGIKVLWHSSTPRLYRRSCWKVIHLERWQLRYWHIGVCLYWSVLVLKCVFIDMLECGLYQGCKSCAKAFFVFLWQ